MQGRFVPNIKSRGARGLALERGEGFYFEYLFHVRYPGHPRLLTTRVHWDFDGHLCLGSFPLTSQWTATAATTLQVQLFLVSRLLIELLLLLLLILLPLCITLMNLLGFPRGSHTGRTEGTRGSHMGRTWVACKK